MEEKNLDKKWFNYFSNMRNKYNMRVSANKILIIFLDAKDSTLNNRFLLKDRKAGFFDSMGLTARYFTNKYNCLSLWGTDEISFIIEDTDYFISSINNEKNFRTHDIVSIFSQYFFEYFNSVYNGETVYWHCKCFNISKEKLQSYIKFKSKSALYLFVFCAFRADDHNFSISLNHSTLVTNRLNRCSNFHNVSFLTLSLQVILPLERS